ncbi:hypothetical protein [Paraburkholderia sp. SIMBA_054]|uniref:hypothetical protein n=1 Tax=Paraburkholderia sp. SIMBA_054 TaxID=3085795 RepID=UPI00397CA24B
MNERTTFRHWISRRAIQRGHMETQDMLLAWMERATHEGDLLDALRECEQRLSLLITRGAHEEEDAFARQKARAALARRERCAATAPTGDPTTTLHPGALTRGLPALPEPYAHSEDHLQQPLWDQQDMLDFASKARALQVADEAFLRLCSEEVIRQGLTSPTRKLALMKERGFSSPDQVDTWMRATALAFRSAVEAATVASRLPSASSVPNDRRSVGSLAAASTAPSERPGTPGQQMLADAQAVELASMKRMLGDACADIASINAALGLDPEDTGAEPIIEAINALKARAGEASAATTSSSAEPQAQR